MSPLAWPEEPKTQCMTFNSCHFQTPLTLFHPKTPPEYHIRQSTQRGGRRRPTTPMKCWGNQVRWNTLISNVGEVIIEWRIYVNNLAFEHTIVYSFTVRSDGFPYTFLSSFRAMHVWVRESEGKVTSSSGSDWMLPIKLIRPSRTYKVSPHWLRSSFNFHPLRPHPHMSGISRKLSECCQLASYFFLKTYRRFAVPGIRLHYIALKNLKKVSLCAVLKKTRNMGKTYEANWPFKWDLQLFPSVLVH